MKRELAIAGGVLVPFALLVAAGFYFSPRTSPLPPGGEGQGEGKIGHVPVAVPVAVPVPVAVRGPSADAGLPSLPPELAAPLKAVLPEVHQCFVDQKLKEPHSVRVRFTPTRNGRFERVQVDEQNPYLSACLEDVFAEVSWHPAGPETFVPAAHTFSFDPSPD